MPLSFGKIGAFIALFTIGAFILWLLITSFFTTEEAGVEAERGGAAQIEGGPPD